MRSRSLEVVIPAKFPIRSSYLCSQSLLSWGLMREVKTYSKGAPFCNAFLRTYPRLEGWEGSLRQIADLGRLRVI